MLQNQPCPGQGLRWGSPSTLPSSAAQHRVPPANRRLEGSLSAPLLALLPPLLSHIV